MNPSPPPQDLEQKFLCLFQDLKCLSLPKNLQEDSRKLQAYDQGFQ